MTNEQELEQIRAAAEGVLEKARNDEAFRASLVEDPVSVLTAAGVPDDAATHIGLAEWQDGEAETTGFMRAQCDGDRYSCIISLCKNIPYTNCGFMSSK